MSSIKPGGKVERKGPGRLVERVADLKDFLPRVFYFIFEVRGGTTL